MYQHGPSCLAGPVSRKSNRWRQGGRPSPAAGRKKQPRPPEGAPIRWDLVNRVRREIAAGTYDTAEKMDAALDRLLERLDNE